MKVVFQGFTLEAGDGINLQDFADVLAAKSSDAKTYLFNSHHRIFLFESVSDPDFHTGLLITTKDQRNFFELRKDGGKYKIKVSELDEGAQLMDFNFFVLNKKTFSGLYQHYYQSCSPAQFGVLLRRVFWKTERDERCAARLKYYILAGMKPEKAEREAETDYRRLLRFSLLYRPDGFRKILKSMSEIRGFQFEISTKLPKHDPFLPQSIELKKETRRILFANKTLVNKIADSVGNFANSLGLKKGHVFAMDATGIERTINLADNIDSFGEFDFDEIAAEVELDIEKFSQSWLIKRLIEAARAPNHRALFFEL